MSLLLTYKLIPIRHHFYWDKSVANDVFQFGKWIVVASALTYIAQQGDRLFFGAYISPAQLGVYSIAFMLIRSLAVVAEQLVTKIWFPLLGKAANENRDKLKRLYYSIRMYQDLILFSVAGGLIALSPQIISILYDDRYSEAGWMMQILSISLIGQGLSIAGGHSLSALGITKYQVKIMIARSSGILLGLPLSFHYFGFEGAVFCVAVNAFLGLPILYIELYKNRVFSLYTELRMLPIVLVGYFIGNTIF